jgi:hypothetical protein
VRGDQTSQLGLLMASVQHEMAWMSLRNLLVEGVNEMLPGRYGPNNVTGFKHLFYEAPTASKLQCTSFWCSFRTDLLHPVVRNTKAGGKEGGKCPDGNIYPRGRHPKLPPAVAYEIAISQPSGAVREKAEQWFHDNPCVSDPLVSLNRVFTSVNRLRAYLLSISIRATSRAH